MTHVGNEAYDFLRCRQLSLMDFLRLEVHAGATTDHGRNGDQYCVNEGSHGVGIA